MDKVEKPSNFDCYTPSSEPFSFYWINVDQVSARTLAFLSWERTFIFHERQ
jgi:hypothetical protein